MSNQASTTLTEFHVALQIVSCAARLRPHVTEAIRDKVEREMSRAPTRQEALAGAAFCFGAGVTVTHAWTPLNPLRGIVAATVLLSQAVWPRALSKKRLAEIVRDAIEQDALGLARAWLNVLYWYSTKDAAAARGVDALALDDSMLPVACSGQDEKALDHMPLVFESGEQEIEWLDNVSARAVLARAKRDLRAGEVLPPEMAEALKLLHERHAEGQRALEAMYARDRARVADQT